MNTLDSNKTSTPIIVYVPPVVDAEYRYLLEDWGMVYPVVISNDTTQACTAIVKDAAAYDNHPARSNQYKIIGNGATWIDDHMLLSFINIRGEVPITPAGDVVDVYETLNGMKQKIVSGVFVSDATQFLDGVSAEPNVIFSNKPHRYTKAVPDQTMVFSGVFAPQFGIVANKTMPRSIERLAICSLRQVLKQSAGFFDIEFALVGGCEYVHSLSIGLSKTVLQSGIHTVDVFPAVMSFISPQWSNSQ